MVVIQRAIKEGWLTDLDKSRVGASSKHVREGKVKGRPKVTRRRGRRTEQLLDDLKEKRE